MEFIPGWLITTTLGEGAFGEVKLLQNPVTMETVALKILQFTKDKDNERSLLEKSEAEKMIKKEVAIHQKLSHDNIVKFYGSRMDQNIWFLFLEYCDGGELYDRIDPDVGLIPQSSAHSYFTQIIAGLSYLHDNHGIVHRDIKPENILLAGGVLKISDFGLATVYRTDGVERLLETKCGSAPYLAPEVFTSKGCRGEGLDVWSVGVVLVVMLGGELPWDKAEASNKEYKSWRESTPASSSPWNKFDLPTLGFFKRLLCPLPGKRIGFEGVRSHPWVVKRMAEKRKMLDPPPPPRHTHSTPSHLPKKSRPSSPDCLALSQPDPVLFSNYPSTPTSRDNRHHDNHPFSFSQPANYPEELLAALPRRLVSRSSRFFVAGDASTCLATVTAILDELCYGWKVFEEGKNLRVITITTTDRRKSRLIFKCNVIEVADKSAGKLVLLDFRLSRGDGIEFKRHFLRLRDALRGIEISGIGGVLEWLVK